MKKHPPNGVAKAEPRNVEEEVRRRAYELFEARGREEGHELEDWFRAEQEITGRMPAPQARAKAIAATS